MSGVTNSKFKRIAKMKQISLQNSAVVTPHFRAELSIPHWKPPGRFILVQNNSVHAFELITVSADAKALNNVGGSGRVRDLQEAGTQSPDLILVLKSPSVANSDWSLEQVS
jgi:hypothetical protein